MTDGKKRITKAPDERRRELVRAARELFVEKGYEATAVSDIVRKVGAAQGTFYWYFSSKQDALLAVHREMMEEVMTLVRAIVASESLTALEKLRHAYEDVVARIESDETLAQAISIRVQPQVHELAMAGWGPEMLDLFAAIIRQGIAEGTFRVARPEMAAAFLVTLGEKIFDEAARGRGLWRLPDDAPEADQPPAAWATSEVTEALWEFALHGLGVERRSRR